MSKFDGNIVIRAVIRDSQLFLAIWDQPRLSSSFHRKNTGVTMAVVVRYDAHFWLYYLCHPWKMAVSKIMWYIGGQIFHWNVGQSVHLRVCPLVCLSICPSIHPSVHQYMFRNGQILEKKCQKSMGNIITYQNHVK